MVLEGIKRDPRPGNVPIEQLGSLESLKLVGRVDVLFCVIWPRGNVTTRALPFPFLSHFELHHSDISRLNPEFGLWLMFLLSARKKAGHGVKTLRVVEERDLGVTDWRLTTYVDVLTIDRIPDPAEGWHGG